MHTTLLNWIEWDLCLQKITFYPVWRTAHYHGNRNFLAMSLWLHYMLLCYSSGPVIHNVEWQSELWNKRLLAQISFPHDFHLTSVNSRAEQGLLKCFCSSWNLKLEMAKSQGRGRCSACSEIRSCWDILWELSLWKWSCQAPNTPSYWATDQADPKLCHPHPAIPPCFCLNIPHNQSQPGWLGLGCWYLCCQ